MKKKIFRSVVCLCLALMTVLAPLSAYAASMAKLVRVNGSDVRLRSSSGAVIEKLYRGEKLMCTGRAKGSN